jgi:hypothetical protein
MADFEVENGILKKVNTILPDIVIPEELNIHTLGDACFSSVKKTLVKIIIPFSVHTIGALSFQDCKKLESILIKGNIIKLGQASFKECILLKSICIKGTLNFIANNTFEGCVSLSNIVLPQSVTTIRADAFSNCYSLLVVPNSNFLEKIQSESFKNCLSLQKINLPNVKNIERYSFMNCSLLEHIKFYPCLTSLDSTAFSKCLNIKKIHLPFQYCRKTYSEIVTGNKNFIIDFGFIFKEHIHEVPNALYREYKRTFNYQYEIPEYEGNSVIFNITLNPNELMTEEAIQEKISKQECHIIDASGIQDIPYIAELSGSELDVSGLIWSNEFGHHLNQWMAQSSGRINELWDDRTWCVLFEGDETPTGDITLADLIFKMIRQPELLTGGNLIVYRDLGKPTRSKSQGDKPTPPIDDYMKPPEHQELRLRSDSLLNHIGNPRFKVRRYSSGGGGAADGPRAAKGGGEIFFVLKNNNKKNFLSSKTKKIIGSRKKLSRKNTNF